MIRVLFVCLGNICRSPTAEGVFRQLLIDKDKDNIHMTDLSSLDIEFDSAGTAAWHEGKAADSRSVAHAAKRGIDLTDLRARQVQLQDFLRFDYILAMDSDNLAHLQALAPANYTGHLGLILDFLAPPVLTKNALQDPALLESDLLLNGLQDRSRVQKANRKKYANVPDPYYEGEAGFELVLDLLDEACRGLLAVLAERKLPEEGVDVNS